MRFSLPPDASGGRTENIAIRWHRMRNRHPRPGQARALAGFNDILLTRGRHPSGGLTNPRALISGAIVTYCRTRGGNRATIIDWLKEQHQPWPNRSTP